jgi:transposase-like protein
VDCFVAEFIIGPAVGRTRWLLAMAIICLLTGVELSAILASIDRERQMAKRPKPVHQLTEAQFEAMFPDEIACAEYLVKRRWPDGVACPRCGNVNVFPVKTMPLKWQCYECETIKGAGYRFSHIAGTIFENTNKPLRQWFKVVHLMLTSKKGISALQIQRHMGFGSYETAHSMCHKIRAALIEPETRLGGIVEVDETFVGGKAKNRHANKRDGKPGPTASGKVIVVGAARRKGNVIARVIDNVKQETLEAFVNEAVSEKVSLLCTDQWVGYHYLGEKFPHSTVDHAKKQYVVGAVHTQTIEGFWSIFKRGIVGSFHKVSRKYMPLYVAEFQFRYNNRMNADIFEAAIARC